MEIQVKTITPAMAKKWLARNTKNRSVKPKHVDNLSRDILAGNWHINGDAIRFNGDGTLLDGQHRLLAIVKSDTPIESIVVTGLPTTSQMTMDQGAKRQAGDQMAVLGVKAANVVAAACRYAMIMREGRWASQSYTISEVLDFYEQNESIGNHAVELGRGPRGSQSLATAMAYVLRQTDPTEVDPFLATWIKGTGEEGNPFLVFREKLIRASLSGQPLPAKRKITTAAWSLSKALAGEAVKVIRPSDSWIIPGWTAR